MPNNIHNRPCQQGESGYLGLLAEGEVFTHGSHYPLYWLECAGVSEWDASSRGSKGKTLST